MKNIVTSFLNEQKLPLVVQPQKGAYTTLEQFQNFLQENRSWISEQLLIYGGVLFRGFPVDGADDFNSFVTSLSLGTPLNYIGGDSPRDKVRDKVYTSTEAPPSFKLPLHQEMSFIKNFPKHIYFYCDIPAAVGGATILADARSIYKELNPVVREKFADKQLNYISHYYRRAPLIELINKVQRGHKSWMEVFETDKKEEVEVRCFENEFGFRWHQGDWLEINQKCPAVNVHPITGEKVWFNQAHLYDFNPRLIGKFNYLAIKLVYYKKHTIMHEITYGDGSPVDRNDLYHVMDVLDKNTIAYPWQKGDCIVLDNVLAMHGRAPFQGKRRILTALTK